MKELCENEFIELKKSTSDLKEAVVSIVAILNKHKRGELYFGIANDGMVVGQDVSEKTLRHISQAIFDNIEPKIYPKITKLSHDDKQYIKVEFEGKEAPYYADGKAYIRVADVFNFFLFFPPQPLYTSLFIVSLLTSLLGFIMTINYFAQSEKYRPDKIDILLVGEGPPPSQKTYFYLPAKMNANRNIGTFRSLPATIFYHYFKSLPSTVEEYEEFLLKLKNKNIFLIDVLDEPLRIRDRSSPNGIHQKNYNRLISQIPKLKEKMKNRNINISEDKIIFLLARTKYKKELQKEFPNSKFIKWIDFRTSSE